MIALTTPTTASSTTTTAASERVHHPRHYNAHPSGVEAIDFLEWMSFNIGNAVKYLVRREHKENTLEDLRKSEWYLCREMDRLLSIEVFRPVIGDDRYQVSSIGRVRGPKGLRKLVLVGKGYRTIMFVVDGRATLRYVHHLVAESFLGPRPEGHDVAHGDGRVGNNLVTNLRYATRISNAEDRNRHHTINGGVRAGQAKLTWTQVDEIRRLYVPGNAGCLAAVFKISSGSITRIARGETYKEKHRKNAPLETFLVHEGDTVLGRVGRLFLDNNGAELSRLKMAIDQVNKEIRLVTTG